MFRTANRPSATMYHVPEHGRPVPPLRTITIGEGYVGVAFEHGVAQRVLEPGRHRSTRAGTTVRLVDLRCRLVVLELQEVPTADGITVRVSLSLLVRTTDARTYLAAGPSADRQAYLAAQVALREVVASRPYDELLGARAALGREVQGGIGDLSHLGLEVERTEARDLVLPPDLRRAQAAVLVARAEGQAALERARGESAALRSLANAARFAADNPALLQLRLIQQLGASTGHTVVVTEPPR